MPIPEFTVIIRGREFGNYTVSKFARLHFHALDAEYLRREVRNYCREIFKFVRLGNYWREISQNFSVLIGFSPQN